MRPKEQHVTVSHPGYSDEFYSEDEAASAPQEPAAEPLNKTHDTTLAANLEAVRMLPLS